MAKKSIPVRLTVEIGEAKYGIAAEFTVSETFGAAPVEVRSLASELAGMTANTVLCHFEAERGRL